MGFFVVFFLLTQKPGGKSWVSRASQLLALVLDTGMVGNRTENLDGMHHANTNFHPLIGEKIFFFTLSLGTPCQPK